MVLKTKPLVFILTIAALLLMAGVSIVAFSLTNPQTKIGNLSLGFKNQTDIEQTLLSSLESTPVAITNVDQKIDTTFGQLGVSLSNSKQVAESVFSDNKMWKIANWGQTVTSTPMQFQIDETKLNDYIKNNVTSYSPVINANVTYENGSYNVISGANGTTIAENEIQTVSQHFFDGNNTLTITTVEPETTDAIAQQFADKLNNLTHNFAVQAGEEQIKPQIDGQLLSWESVITENTPLIVNMDVVSNIADQLPGLINREGIANENIIDSQNTVLYTTRKGQSERALNDSKDSLEDKIKTALETNNTVTVADVKETKPADVNSFRRIEVNLSEQKTYMYENNQLVKTYTISSGKAGTDTHTGDFRIRAFVREQDMGCVSGYSYCTKDVPWVVYFNGDEAFHGTYWHNNFGTPMSHGCVNMTISDAQELYRWSYEGMEVSVHY